MTRAARACAAAGLAALLLGVAVPLAVRSRTPGALEPSVARDRPNVLLFSIDTLRADHLGSYGYRRNTSPNLDRLAKRSLRFTQAFAPAPWTLPSHVSMMTGVHPHELGIENRESSIPDEAQLVSEVLAEAGYRTAALVDSMPRGFVGGKRGFSRGFDEYRHLPAKAKNGHRYDMAVTADAAVKWLRDYDDPRPFFLFLHTKSVHARPSHGGSKNPMRFPYDKPAPYRSRFLSQEAAQISWKDPQLGNGVDYLRGLNERLASGELQPSDVSKDRIDALESLYDAGIYYVDDHFGRVLEQLEASGQSRRTVVIVTSDHGEAFLDHNLFLHKEVYRSVLHVPLILHVPWDPTPRESARRVGLMDIAPAILDLTGVPRPAHLTGPGLSFAHSGEAGPEENARHFAYYHSRSGYYYEAYALREGRWTLVHHRLGRKNPYETELYDDLEDPDELRPVTDQPERERAMLENLLRWRAHEPRHEGAEIELDAETVEHLRALGYVD
jgi:arylsulfatase A-like enzyme